MPLTVGDQILQALRGWGVRRVFDGINDILAGVGSELAEVLPSRRRT